VTAALIHLRKTKPDLYRPMKFSLLLPILFTFGCMLLTAVAIFADPVSAFWGFVFMATGWPLFHLQKSLMATNCGTSITRTIQKLLLIATPEESKPMAGDL
jgi:hypothetical protein